MNGNGGKNSRLILAAMIFAVSMTFIDQTIVAIAVPTLQKDLHLSTTGVQWIINGYLLSLAALFAFGGRLADIAGHRRMVVIGVIVFATASALCGATPTGSGAEVWIIVFRIIQGAGAAIMFPPPWRSSSPPSRSANAAARWRSSSPASRPPPSTVAKSSTGSGRGRPWWRAARSPRSGSSSGATRSPAFR
jgi:MFS family permease